MALVLYGQVLFFLTHMKYRMSTTVDFITHGDDETMITVTTTGSLEQINSNARSHYPSTTTIRLGRGGSLILDALPAEVNALLASGSDLKVEIKLAFPNGVTLTRPLNANGVVVDAPVVYVNGDDIRVNGKELGTAPEAEAPIDTVVEAPVRLPIGLLWKIKRDEAIAEGHLAGFEESFGSDGPNATFKAANEVFSSDADVTDPAVDAEDEDDTPAVTNSKTVVISTGDDEASAPVAEESADGVVEIPATTDTASTAPAANPATDTTTATAVSETDDGKVEVPATPTTTDTTSAVTPVEESSTGVVEVPAETTETPKLTSEQEVVVEKAEAVAPEADITLVTETPSGKVELPVFSGATTAAPTSSDDATALAADAETPRDDIGNLPTISDEELVSHTSSVTSLGGSSDTVVNGGQVDATSGAAVDAAGSSAHEAEPTDTDKTPVSSQGVVTPEASPSAVSEAPVTSAVEAPTTSATQAVTSATPEPVAPTTSATDPDAAGHTA